MTVEQGTILVILGATVAMFLWGRWRHDIVAITALIACVVVGLVPSEDAFGGLGHPAVVTVACVLVLSRTLQLSGAVDVLAERCLPSDAGPTLTVAALAGLAAFLSAFMNNVGALALLMPVAIQIAGKQGMAPGRLLMPLSFGSILGGMTTLIGTPPNLIVAGFRSRAEGSPFGMFDFTPVGAAIALVGVAFVALVGWRLVPARQRTGIDDFDTGAYLTEARVPKRAKAVGMTVQEVEKRLEEEHAQLVGLVRNEVRIGVPRPSDTIRANDILVVEAEPEGIAAVLSALGLELEEAVEPRKDEVEASAQSGEAKAEDDERGNNHEALDVVLIELAVLPNAPLAGRSASQARIRSRFGINLLAVSRQGRRSIKRLRTMPLRAGDVLLMQGSSEAIAEFASQFACVPLAERSLRIPDARRAIMAVSVLAAAVAVTASGLVSAAVAFAGGVLGVVLLRLISPRRLYDAVDWPVIVLLAALLPVAAAMEATGTADLLARALLDEVARGHAIVALVLILIVTMTLSDLVNNAATAAVMCPIAISTAGALDANPDAFLMAVAVGASCAFLTPIGHQNNTLILGPGGFRFTDYWRLGLPMEVIVIAVGVPMILLVWPL